VGKEKAANGFTEGIRNRVKKNTTRQRQDLPSPPVGGLRRGQKEREVRVREEHKEEKKGTSRRGKKNPPRPSEESLR